MKLFGRNQEPEVPVYTVMLNYKSGRSESIRVTAFEFKSNGNDRSATWTLHKSTKIRPLFVNIADIESVWKVS